MTIGFFTPHGEVSETVIIYMKEKLMDLYHRNNRIDGAEVVFRNQLLSLGHDHICEVTLSFDNEMLIVHRSAANYKQAAMEVIWELNLKVEEYLEGEGNVFVAGSTVKI